MIMKVLVVLAISMLAMLIYRGFFVLLIRILVNLKKLEKPSEIVENCFWVLYLLCFWLIYVESAVFVSKHYLIGNFEWYTIYWFLGGVTILGCYFRVNMSNFFKIRLVSETTSKVFRLILYIGVLAYTFWSGFLQINNEVLGAKKSVEVVIGNVTILAAIFALDRILDIIKYFYLQRTKKV